MLCHVGGGLSAAQAALCAVDKGAAAVTLCSRRPLETRHFDLPLAWFDPRHINKQRFAFYEVMFVRQGNHTHSDSDQIRLWVGSGNSHYLSRACLGGRHHVITHCHLDLTCGSTAADTLAAAAVTVTTAAS